MMSSPVHEYQMLPQELDDRPTCDESLFFEVDETWKSGDSGIAVSDNSSCSSPDCVPTTVSSPFEVQASPEQNSPIIGSNAILGGQVDAYRWQTRSPQSWTILDVALWIQCMAVSMQTGNIQSNAFADVDGPTLCKMGMDEFVQREPTYGMNLYMAFQNLFNNNLQYQQQTFVPRPTHNEHGTDYLTSIEKYINFNNISFDKDDTFPSLPPLDSLLPAWPNQPKTEPQPFPKIEPTAEDYSESDAESEASSSASVVSSPKTGRRGRSKGKLWEFVLNLLLDEATNPTIIKWEDRTNGVFRIVRSDQVAKLWGKRKSNPTMTYEKMSRALRYYYRKDILERIDGRRLVYKFGSRSKGWQL